MTQTTKKTLIGFATCWGTKFGGINCFNTDLLSAISTTFYSEVDTICVVLYADKDDESAAISAGVKLVSLSMGGAKEFGSNLLENVSIALRTQAIQFESSETVWLGHDRITGAIAIAATKEHGGHSALIHHMSYAHYEFYAEDSVAKQKKVREQKNLFSKADIVFAVGPLLREALRDMLEGQDVPMIIPGLPEIKVRVEPYNFKAFLSGRLNDSARKIKQAYLGVAAFGNAISQCTKDIRLPDALHLSKEPQLILRGVDFENSDGTIDKQAESDLLDFAECYSNGVFELHALPFTTDRDELFDDLRASSVAMMPSWHEGFGLVAWEAIAAGVPLILSKKSGAYRLLESLNLGNYCGMVSVIDVAGSFKEPYFCPSDLENLANALIMIAKEPTKYRIKAVELRRVLHSEYTWAKCAKQFINTFGWSLNEKPPLADDKPVVHVISDSVKENLIVAIDVEDVRKSFADISAIGRSWKRDILGVTLATPTLDLLLAAIEDDNRSILLTGSPGSGKTCVMLALQDQLETQADSGVVSLFIQSSEFADQATILERQAQGLPENWVDDVASISKILKVVVIIDSLDVLSIAREHSVLTYFLVQIDRLLLMPNVTVVASCRDFDRLYDRRIAARTWDCEFQCGSLNWEGGVQPLLRELQIESSNIDSSTRELIRNPRELALFVELVKREGSFNIVNSQSLAQLYLTKFVQANSALGDPAMQVLEAIAAEMLETRSLSVYVQRIATILKKQEILRELLSLKVLRESNDGRLTFGHQTLLDVLVISGAIRNGLNLFGFISKLPQVPFVRPSIRSFIAQLASGDRKEFRKQLRSVLESEISFHVRRLVAESFSEQKPLDEDWQFLNELRLQHKDVFQVIYNNARRIEWHFFWLKYLVPILNMEHDGDGLLRHAFHVQRWQDNDAEGVLKFWSDLLDRENLDKSQLVSQLGFYLSEINVQRTTVLLPLLEKLISFPRQAYSYLGRVVARCVIDQSVDDLFLWRFVAGEISEDDVLAFQFGVKLHCDEHEFGDRHKEFFNEQMKSSSILLDLAVNSVEAWTTIRIEKKGMWMAGSMGFLGKTSYKDIHSFGISRNVDPESALMSAIEGAILHNALDNSDWWQANRYRLCTNKDGALRYFGILGCTVSQEFNFDLIQYLLTDKALLASELSFELGSLIRASFIYLECSVQDAVLAAILSTWEEELKDAKNLEWVLNERAKLLIAIPRHMRSQQAQKLLDDLESLTVIFDHVPQIVTRGGIVSAPFSFEVFLRASDAGVLCLLSYYDGQSDLHGDDFLIGGEREVGWQLREAVSRLPSRFLDLLVMNWNIIPPKFCDDILDGVATYLNYQYGNLQSNSDWLPVEDVDAANMAKKIIEELERHSGHWNQNRSASNALLACSNVIESTELAERLVFLAIGFISDSDAKSVDVSTTDLLTVGINMKCGNVIEALTILTCKLLKRGTILPDLLRPTLRRFAAIESPAIRAVLLRRLHNLQAYDADLSWELFNIAVQSPRGLGESAEYFFYYSYKTTFEKISSTLDRLRTEGTARDLEVWSRISALAALSNKIDFLFFLETLKSLDDFQAWQGASSVWTNIQNMSNFRDQCLNGIQAGLNARMVHATVVAKQVDNLFGKDAPLVILPSWLIKKTLDVLGHDSENKHFRLNDFDGWVNAVSQHFPEDALSSIEIYLAHVKRTSMYIHDYEKNLSQLLTRLFVVAEEKEVRDNGEMLQRVIAVQDTLLGLGVNGMIEWLKDAERP